MNKINIMAVYKCRNCQQTSNVGPVILDNDTIGDFIVNLRKENPTATCTRCPDKDTLGVSDLIKTTFHKEGK
jgi:hypothetical protein